MNIVQQLYSVASVNPAKTAVVANNKAYSYKKFISDINIITAYLKQKNITPGDYVLLAVPISYKLYVYFAALLNIGAVIVIVDDWSSVRKVNACLANVNCKAVVISPKYYLFSYFIKGLKDIPVKIKATIKPGSQQPLPPIFDAGKNHPALVTFTTGSTGQPKAAVRTHKVLGEQFRMLDEIFSFSQKDVLMSNLPIVTLLGFAKGGTAVLPGKIKYSPVKGFNKIINQLQYNQVNCLLGSPAFLLNIASKLPASFAVGIRKIGIGGATVSPRQWDALKNTFNSAEITVVYGSTEAEPISSSKEAIATFDNSVFVGRAVAGVRIKIIAISNGPVNCVEELGPGQMGEIIVTGPQVVNNYLDKEEVFKHNKIIDGDTIWHRTGDAGVLNEKGELFFSGRCKWLFTVNGKWSSPLAYELLFEASSNIAEGTAIMANGKVHVFIVPRYKAGAADITSIPGDNGFPCNEVHFMKYLPKDKRHHSKINYELLKSRC